MSALHDNKINLQQLLNKEHVFISSDEAMSDITPIRWEDSVVNGAKKIVLVTPKATEELSWLSFHRWGS